MRKKCIEIEMIERTHKDKGFEVLAATVPMGWQAGILNPNEPV
jgi:hypothetical protein